MWDAQFAAGAAALPLGLDRAGGAPLVAAGYGLEPPGVSERGTVTARNGTEQRSGSCPPSIATGAL